MCSLKIRKSIMAALMFFLLASQMLHIFGNVTVLRGSVWTENSSSIKSRKLICLSEDDGSALVWNDDLIENTPFERPDITKFHSVNGFNNNEIDCKMNTHEGCLTSWNTNNWYLTNSTATPMAPVFDQRWEDFQEYEILEDSYYYLDSFSSSAAKLSFSVRGLKDVHMLLCNGTNYEQDFCYWIIIGGWKNTKSIIRKCPTGVPNPTEYPNSTSECAISKVCFEHTPLSPSEWRSFVITWDSVTRNITVYDTDNLIMTYVDKEQLAKEQTARSELRHSSVNYQVFIRSISPMLYRFHRYNFLYTTNEQAPVISPSFKLTHGTICVQLLIGLCAECYAFVSLYNPANYNLLKTLTVMGQTTIHGLPTWQSVKIETNLRTRDSNMIIYLYPGRNTFATNTLWAIANVRQCPSNGSLREASMISHPERISGRHFWPSVTCQKLFYGEHTVVNSTFPAEVDVKSDHVNCPEGKIGPQCLFSCERNLNSRADCRETAICYKRGCTCPPGFLGPECSQYCDSTKYGHNCKKTCGSCNKLSRYEPSSCNKVTGVCDKGCNNTEKFYVPSLCQIGIDKPTKPTIDFTKETSIRAIVPITWKDEYGETMIFYFFVIREILNKSYYTSQSLSRVFPNTTQLIGNFENLKPGTAYSIMCRLTIENSTVDSEWLSAETKCNLIQDFGYRITPGEHNLTINRETNKNQSYSCPANGYKLVVKKIDKNNIKHIIYKSDEIQFPHEVPDLIPYTSYDVFILCRNCHIFSGETRTLESVPSGVLNLNVKTQTSKQVTLYWEAPKNPNGEIVQYNVILKVEEYTGCKDLCLSTPNRTIERMTKKTMITFSDLQPYARYSALVVAHNSRNGSQDNTKINFYAKESEIPAEKFSNFTSQDWILSWSAPEDCATISGPLKARIQIRGMSDAVKDIKFKLQTQDYRYDLTKKREEFLGAERYVAKLYVIRDWKSLENVSAYQEHEFETPPAAPPKVTNLEIVEIDTRSMSETIHLRWQKPLLPLNGKLNYYSMKICKVHIYPNMCVNTIYRLNQFCYLWDDYICGTYNSTEINSEIQILAYNINVTEPSPAVFVTANMFSNTRVPDPPRNCTFTIKDNSVVDLRWYHPWKTGRHLQYFLIRMRKISSNLTEHDSQPLDIEIQYPVIDYMRNYSQRLYLFPSTIYEIGIQAVTVANESSKNNTLIIQTPTTINFGSDLKTILIVDQESDSTITINIPPILNNTRHSVMHVIVEAPEPSKKYSEVPQNLREQIGIKMYEIAWEAAELFPASDFAGNTFRIGDNKIYGRGTNYPLKVEELYKITIIITEGNFVSEPITFKTRMSPKHHETWLIPILLCLIVVGIAFYFYKRRRQQSTKQLMLQDEIVLSGNFENYEHETTSVISTSKQDLSTPSDRQSLSRATTPEVSPIAVENDGEKKDMVSLVKVKDFEDYVRQAIQSGLLDKQYETFPRGQTQPWDYGKLPQNKSKNRYGNLIAYDETRVILKKLPNDAYSDYINANYITGYKKKKRYIATQGPKPNTVIDFWHMIWQENVLIICMLTNVIESGKTKCEQYWPDIGKKKKYGDIIVLNAKHNVFADYCFRTFQVTCGHETRKIEHLHYTAWPDHGVPLYTHSVVAYLKKLLATPPGNGPVVVHCSAGVGRTGTIILCDICLHRAAAEGFVDTFAETASIRSERANMVDNKQQYLLAHLALVECLLSIPTSLPCNEMLPTRIKEMKQQLSAQQQRLRNTAWQNEALCQVASPPSLSERNRAKNRFPELISDKVSRIYLKRYPISDEDSDYLSAVYVDGVKLQNQYLATQLPLPSTINDFWRMIAEFKVELILMLQAPDPEDPTCCAIAPASDEFKPTPYLNITTKEIVELEYYTSRKLLLVDHSEKPSREQSVTILCLTEWKPGRDQPLPPVMTMVTLWQAAERIARGDGPTVTLCHNGVTGCGLYLALNFLLERMAVERECDICLAVRAIRRSRPDFVQSLEQLEYLYDAAVAYLEYFETYANFS